MELPSNATASSTRYRFRILGVYDEASGDPLDGVEVRDVLSGVSSLTTETGTVSLFFVPDGGGLVRLRKIGYEMRMLAIAISPSDTAPVTVTLQRVTQLPTVVVKENAPVYRSPLLQQVERRLQSHAGGHFIDEATLRKLDNSTLGNAIIARIPGLMPGLGPHGEGYLLSSRATCTRALSCTHPDCYPDVFLDGVRFADPVAAGSARLDFSRLFPSDYAIVEFYAGGASIPVEFSSSPCGVVLLWSRER